MCHFQVSSHCWWVPFCHRVLVLYGLPLLLPPPPPCAMCLCRLLTLLTAFPLFNRGLVCLASEYCCLHRHPAPCAYVVCSRC
ncbi:unnamed protein product [Staurois parvus]|uniref:Secreted protein n=1 Tax=Staurois parvus TaxID=386267 RepID=A0ABN9FFL1_9NEOB|nr:unnamed protein product [Staurois parvus]